jgi:DNA-binding NarL/FixJ family response regulator
VREPPPEAQAYLLACHAEASRLAGRHVPELWVRAGAAFELLGIEYLCAYLSWREAEAALTRSVDGSRARAKHALDKAYAIALRLEAKPLLDEVAALRRAARLGAPASVTVTRWGGSASASVDRLTSRETDVLLLLADGLTNREIAARLYIAEKTTAVHVTHILGKLGATNRTAAVAAARRLGLFDTATQID